MLLGVGAVLLVRAGATVAAAYGGHRRAALLLALAAAATVFSLRGSGTGLRSSEEALAACAAGLALAGSSPGGPALDGDPVTALLLAAGFLVLHRFSPDDGRLAAGLVGRGPAGRPPRARRVPRGCTPRPTSASP